MSTLDYKIQSQVHKKAKLSKLISNILYYKYLYLMLLPGISFFIIFRYVPMYGIQLAFKDFNISMGITGSPWIGFENFYSLVREKAFIIAFFNTLIISAMKIVLGFPVPIILAILINELRTPVYKRVLQTVYTFPHFLSWVILAGMSMNLLSSTGAINNLLAILSFERQDFLTNKATFRYLLVFTEIWKEAGWGSIIYLAAIAGIDTTIYEAATIDGANRFDKIVYITWPGIAKITIVFLILSLGNIMEAGFMQVFNMYNPAVYDVADILDTYIYRITFQQSPNFGFSTAVGLFKGLTNFILLITANKITKLFGYSGII